MAITQEEILQLTVSMFNASLGANYLADIESANFATTTELAAYYGTLTQFTSQFDGMTDAEQVTAMLSNFGLDSTNTAAFDYFTAQVAAGVSNAVTLQAADAYLATQTAEVLATYNLTDAAATLVNKTAAATYYSVTTAQSAATVDDLQATVSTITEDVATVATANAAVDTTVAAAVVTAAINTAAEAAYAEDTIAADATAAEIAVANALTLTTAADAIEAGATQAEIDAALAVITTTNAATLTLAQIVALDDSNTAVTTALAAVDTTVVTAAATAATVAEVDTTIAAEFVAYNAIVDHDSADTLTDITDAGDLADSTYVAPTTAVLADVHAANVAVLNSNITISTAELAVTQATLDGTDGLEEAYDLASTASETYTTKFVAEATAQSAVDDAEAAYNAVNNATATLNTDGTVSDTAIVDVVGVDGTAVPVAATVTFTFGALKAGQSVTVDDVTITAAEAMTGTEVADAFTPLYTIEGFTAETTSDADVLYTQTVAGLLDVSAEITDDLVMTIGGTEEYTAALVSSNAAEVAAQAAFDTAETALEDAIVAVAQVVEDLEAVPGTLVIGDLTTPYSADADGVVTFNFTADASDVQDFIDAQADLVLANTAMTDLSTAKTDLDVILAIADTLDPLITTQTTASDALVGETDLADATTEAGVASTQDVSFITDLVAGNAATITLNAFEADTDYLYVGSDYTVNTGALTTGDNTMIEMFITEGTTDADTLLTFETAAFGSASESDFFTVELTGLAVADVTVNDGLISF